MADIYLHKIQVLKNEAAPISSLYEILKKELSDVSGKVWIIPAIDIHGGTGTHDVDILLIGYLNGYCVDQVVPNYDEVEVSSFCTCIELKAHGASGIWKDGTHVKVKYPDGTEESVTLQSEKQKKTLVSYLKENLRFTDMRVPYITNLIWLTGITDADFRQSIGLVQHPILTMDLTAADLFRAIGIRSDLRKGEIDAFANYTEDEIEFVAQIFCAQRNGVDTMSLARLNHIQEGNNLWRELEKKSDPIIVLSGHAGTGKTVMLLQAANYLQKKGKKCLYLTYNHALISDLKHTIGIMKQIMPRITFSTVHSFLISKYYKLSIWDKNKDLDADFRNATNTYNRIFKESYVDKDYDYVFVDEAQDWESFVAEALKKVFQKSHIVIADGIDQFMKSSEHTDWGLPSFPKLRICLRQRANLTSFAMQFASKMGVYWDVMPNSALGGGRVIITNDYNPEKHKALVSDAKTHLCTDYDIMMLVPNSLISEQGEFKFKKNYEQSGVNIFDGVNPANREVAYDQMNQENNECRVFTYESSRGLEAWTTICFRFDELFSNEAQLQHSHSYSEIPYTAARMYMLTLWSLIPLTRAVDTLVITVKDPNSPIGLILKEIYLENKGFVTYDVK